MEFFYKLIVIKSTLQFVGWHKIQQYQIQYYGISYQDLIPIIIILSSGDANPRPFGLSYLKTMATWLDFNLLYYQTSINKLTNNSNKQI